MVVLEILIWLPCITLTTSNYLYDIAQNNVKLVLAIAITGIRNRFKLFSNLMSFFFFLLFLFLALHNFPVFIGIWPLFYCNPGFFVWNKSLGLCYTISVLNLQPRSRRRCQYTITIWLIEIDGWWLMVDVIVKLSERWTQLWELCNAHGCSLISIASQLCINPCAKWKILFLHMHIRFSWTVILVD